MNSSGSTLWFTGLSGAGKTTVAQGVYRELKQRGCRVDVLDGDEIRTNLCRDLGFNKEDRDENIRRIGFAASLLNRNQVIAIVAAISPYRSVREEVRKLNKNFVEIYVKASLETCEKRDVKGLYAKARAGQIKNFTGIDDPYEPPLYPDVVCYTEHENIQECVCKIIFYLEEMKYISPK